MWRKIIAVVMGLTLCGATLAYVGDIKDAILKPDKVEPTVRVPKVKEGTIPVYPGSELLGVKGTEYDLHYDGPAWCWVGVSGWPVHTAIRLTPDELAPYAGQEIVAVLFAVGDEIDTAIVKLYLGDDIVNDTIRGPREQILEDTIIGLHRGVWHRVDLSTPYMITGAETLWVAVRWFSTADQYPVRWDWGPAVPYKGDWFSWDGTPGSWFETRLAGWGDWANANMNIRAVVDVEGVELISEGFESGMPEGWTVLNLGDDTEGNTWTITGYNVHTGDSAVVCEYGASGEFQDEWMITPVMSIPAGATVTLEFYHDMMAWSWDTDPNYVRIGTDPTDTGTFTVVWDYYYEDGDPDPDWEAPVVIDLSAYAGQDICIAWQYRSTWGEDWYVDDIKVKSMPPVPHDVRVVDIFGVPDMITVGDSILPSVIVENLTTNDEYGILRIWTEPHAEASPYYDNWFWPLYGQQVDTIQNYEYITFNTPGTYKVVAYVDLGGDMIAENDRLDKEIVVTPPLTYEEGFETAVIPPPDWQQYILGDPSSPGWRVYTGMEGWTFVDVLPIEGNYAVAHNDDYLDYEAEDWLVTPLLAIGDAPAYLMFYHMTNYAPTYTEYRGVWVSTGSPNPADGDYVELLDMSDIASDEEWSPVIIDLSGYANDTVYIGFKYVGNGADEWFIDGFAGYGISYAVRPYDFAVMRLANIVDGQELPVGSTQNIGVVIQNPVITGGGPADMRLTCRIVRDVDGAIVFNKHRDIFDFPMGVDTIWFNDWTPVEPGGYTINIVVNVEEGVDPNLMNNMLTVNVTAGAKMGEQEVTRFFFHGPTPNPAAGTSVIEFGLPKATRVEFRLVDVAGRTVREVNETMASGVHTIILDNLATGVYFYRFSAGTYVSGGKLVVVR